MSDMKLGDPKTKQLPCSCSHCCGSRAIRSIETALDTLKAERETNTEDGSAEEGARYYVTDELEKLAARRWRPIRRKELAALAAELRSVQWTGAPGWGDNLSTPGVPHE